MGVSAFVGGFVPLRLQLSPSHLNAISIFSVGILIGTSLVLVIPEGVATLYGAVLDGTSQYLSQIMGLSLLAGFAMMYILDNLLAILAFCSIQMDTAAIVDPSQPITISVLMRSVVRSSLTSGLILHALTDGVSLGSSFVKGDLTFEIVFFVAIIIHKLPTAFSLSTILLREGQMPKVILIHLALFSILTPLSAIITFVIIKLTSLDNELVVGIMFLFSAGTFLYVVSHVMTEIYSVEDEKSEFTSVPATSDSEATVVHHLANSLNGTEVALTLAGMAITTLLSFIDHE